MKIKLTITIVAIFGVNASANILGPIHPVDFGIGAEWAQGDLDLDLEAPLPGLPSLEELTVETIAARIDIGGGLFLRAGEAKVETGQYDGSGPLFGAGFSFDISKSEDTIWGGLFQVDYVKTGKDSITISGRGNLPKPSPWEPQLPQFMQVPMELWYLEASLAAGPTFKVTDWLQWSIGPSVSYIYGEVELSGRTENIDGEFKCGGFTALDFNVGNLEGGVTFQQTDESWWGVFLGLRF